MQAKREREHSDGAVIGPAWSFRREETAVGRYSRPMPRFLMGWLLGLGANAIALLLCALIFQENFRFTSAGGFVLAVVVFAVCSGVFTWFVLKFLLRHAGSLIALTGLAATLIALIVTTIFTGLEINGASTWVLSSLLIWVVSMFIWVIPGPWRVHRKADARPNPSL